MNRATKRAFSLVEVLAAVSIIGVITFLAIPNIVAVKQDSEENLAIARAEAVNMAMASYIQALGRTNAITQWATKNTQQLRYEALASFLAFAPSAKEDYMPTNYDVDIPASLATLSKVALTGPSGSITY